MNIFGFEIRRKNKNINSNFSTSRQIKQEVTYQKEISNISKNLSLDSSSEYLLEHIRKISVISPAVSGYLDLMESKIYGDNGFILDLDTKNENFNQLIELKWNEWHRNCDFLENNDFRDFERIALLHYLRDGECFIYLQNAPEGLKLKIINPENIDFNYEDQRKIRKGIEFDNNGKAIFFYCKKNNQREYIKIPAPDIIHLKRSLYQDQVRGFSKIAPIMLKIYQSNSYLESIINQANIASRLSLIAMPNEGLGGFDDGSDLSDEQDNQIKAETIELADGKIYVMNKGFKIESLNQNQSLNIEQFMLILDRQIARALGVSYATYTGDLTKGNFASVRWGVDEERGSFKRLQNLIIRKVHIPIYERFIENLLMLGEINANQYKLALQNYSFKTQGFSYIDPLKDTQAQILQIQNGLTTHKKALSDKGVELRSHARDLKESNDVILDELSRLKSVFEYSNGSYNGNSDTDKKEDNK